MKGDGTGAVEALKRAQLLDPASPMIGSDRGLARHATGATDSAIVMAKRATDFDPSLAAPRLIYGTLLLDAGRTRDAVHELEHLRATSPADPVMLGALGAAYGVAGQRDRAEQILASLEAAPAASRSPTAIAKVRLALGDNEGAISSLVGAAATHDPALATEPFMLRFWDPIRADPRFAAIVKQVGLGNVIVVRRPREAAGLSGGTAGPP